jgi:hypothetical protein
MSIEEKVPLEQRYLWFQGRVRGKQGALIIGVAIAPPGLDAFSG